MFTCCDVIHKAKQETFSSPVSTILLACGRDRELWEQPFWNNKGNNRILPIRCHAVCIYGAYLKWLRPKLSTKLSILAAGQKARGLWNENWTWNLIKLLSAQHGLEIIDLLFSNSPFFYLTWSTFPDTKDSLNYALNFLKLLCNRSLFPNKISSLVIAKLSIYHIASLTQENTKDLF